jgi:hypothetical protein
MNSVSGDFRKAICQTLQQKSLEKSMQIFKHFVRGGIRLAISI